VLKFEKEHPEGLKLEEYPRLADFAEVCEIISRCMGNEPMEFMQAFEKNVSLKHRTAIEDSSVGKAIQFFIKDKKDWEGRMTDLLSHLKLIAISELQIESIKNVGSGLKQLVFLVVELMRLKQTFGRLEL
jgi:hypothetical protein